MKVSRAVVALLLCGSVLLACAEDPKGPPKPAAADPKAAAKLEGTPRPADAKDKSIDPAVGIAAATAGAVSGLPLSISSGGAISPNSAASVVANKVVAADSAGKALGSLVGAVLNKKPGTLHQSARLGGQALVELVRALTSLHVAGGQLTAAGVNTALGKMITGVRQHALTLGEIYTELLGEYGRALGGGLNAFAGFATSGAGRALNPISIGLDALNFQLNTLVSFLQGAVDLTAGGGPGAAAAVAPFIGTLKAVQGVLNALGQILLGPPRPGQAIGGAGGGPVGGVLDLIKVAQSLVEKLLKLP